MAKIGLTEGFTLIPEGTHIFQITDVKYKEDFGKLEIYTPKQRFTKNCCTPTPKPANPRFRSQKLS